MVATVRDSSLAEQLADYDAEYKSSDHIQIPILPETQVTSHDITYYVSRVICSSQFSIRILRKPLLQIPARTAVCMFCE